jgi:eukaryotic-like serine/threonine-protein kinase
MSPEQARGLKVDTRTDIFSLGVVIYEMIAGRGPFEGESASEIIAAILDREPPPLARYSREAPEAIEWIVTKALRKDREERYQTAKELLSDLRGLKQRLEFQAEMERSTLPDVTGPAVAATSGRRVAETANQIGIQTEGARAIRTTSSAEYIVNQIKGHKLGAVITLVALASIVILVVTISSRYFGSAD